MTNTISERVTGALYRRAAEQTDAAAVPFSRWHSVNADVVGIGEAIESVLLNFSKTQHFIAFGAVQQQCAIVEAGRCIARSLTRLRCVADLHSVNLLSFDPSSLDDTRLALTLAQNKTRELGLSHAYPPWRDPGAHAVMFPWSTPVGRECATLATDQAGCDGSSNRASPQNPVGRRIRYCQRPGLGRDVHR